MSNGFVYVELATGDVGAAKQFYAKIFGWSLTESGDPSYTMIDTGEGNAAGGMMAKGLPDQPTAWLPYVEVKSVKGTIEKARKAGAQIVVPYRSIGEWGAIGVFVDPTGAALGVWEMPGKLPKLTTKATKKAAKGARKSAKKPTKRAAKKRAK